MKKKKTGLFIILGLIFVIAFSALISNLTAEEEAFNNITYSEYKKLYKSDDLEFVYVGRPGCGACQITEPILEDSQEETDVVWNYLNTDTMSQSDFADIASTAEEFTGEWGTPTMLAIKDGKVLNSISGYRDKDVVIDFIQTSKKGEKWEETTE
jgi:predicted bacteriocin transport accessory protein